MTREARCPFCEATAPLLENEYAYVRGDNFPVSAGHVLVIPRRHVPGYFELTEEEQYGITRLLAKAKALLDGSHQPSGYNIGINVGPAAGQTVNHAHVHLIPRYPGDVQHPEGGVRGVIPDKQKY